MRMFLYRFRHRYGKYQPYRPVQYEIDYLGTIFQIFENCFPKQFLYAKVKRQPPSASPLNLKHQKTSLHKAWANLQWSKRWSTVSPSHQHKQHQLTRDNSLLTRLLMVRILSQPIVHKKKDTFRCYTQNTLDRKSVV